MSDLAGRIEDALAEGPLSEVELARRLGVSPENVGQVLRGLGEEGIVCVQHVLTNPPQVRFRHNRA